MVEDLDEAAKRAVSLGATVIAGRRTARRARR